MLVFEISPLEGIVRTLRTVSLLLSLGSFFTGGAVAQDSQDSSSTTGLDELLSVDGEVTTDQSEVDTVAPEVSQGSDIAAPATPASPAEPVAKRRPANRFVEEIVVTAQKREESLQDVPISVQAFSGDALDAKGIDDPKALQLVTPGLQYNLFAGYSLIYIRGVGTDAFIPSADASVATYIDNVYYSFGHSLASSFGAVERVEVLKGPQGTLFGRNSTGGAINIVTKDPGPDPETSIQVSGASYDQFNNRIYTNVPVTENLAFSIAGLYNSEDNYYDRSSTSPYDSYPHEITKGFRAKARYQPIEDLSILLSATHLEQSGGLSMMLPATDIKLLGALVGISEQPDYESDTDAPVFIDTRTNVYSGDIQYATPWFDTRLILAKQDIISPALADYDGSVRPLVTFETVGQYADVKTGELQFISNSESWGADRFEWIVGLFTIESSAGYDPLYLSVAPGVFSLLENPDAGPLLGVVTSITDPLLDLLDGVPGVPAVTDLLDNGVTLGLEGVLDTDSTAGFFQGTYDFTDNISLTVGGRYQTETRRLVKSNVGLVVDASQGEAGTRVITFQPQEEDTSNFSPKVVLDVKAFDGQLFYLSYSKGFKSGTFNIINIYTPTQYIEPEEVTSYELGVKSELFDGRLRINAAIFQNTIDNLQVQTISLTSGGAVKFETAGGAEIRGADFDLTWFPLPNLLPDFVLTAGGAYLSGEYTDYTEGSGFDEVTGLYFDGTIFPSRDFTGNEVVRTPEFSGNLGLAYTFTLGDGVVEMAGDMYYNSGFYYSAQNTETASEDSYQVFNARVSYLYEPWGTRITLFGKNLTGAKYHYVTTELDFGTAKLLAPPETYGVRINWDF